MSDDEVRLDPQTLLILWGRYGFDRDRSSSGGASRLRLVKRYLPIITGKQENYSLAAA